MSAMALPGPWAWNNDGEHVGRPCGPRSRRFAGGRRGGPGHGHPHGGGHRAEFGPIPPEPPVPPLPPGGPGGWGPGPFGPGGPFGGFGPHGGGRGGGRRGGPRARRGDVRTAILLLLAEEPRSGYEIIREGRERSGGAWRPSPGSVYPMLQQLEDEGLVEQETGEGRRRPYRLTEEGIDHLEERGADLTPPWEAAADAYADDRSRYEEIGTLAYQLGAAAVQVAQAGTEEQMERAKRLLSDTKRGLYRILADDDTVPRGDDDLD
ncbi:PadR family transcriptional regulator [Nocardiopsis sp. N85]|uniref:PadR family transcriptional regulator n=1 Tax=Nocardiopsis sp. N85 TaxID=3029400 RepID=UPI00237F4444|nr:PadR family transcriptional regulator [Nocardiopsis sp. N85]MDE3720287.1 PadR family transcriptional regulator [Nocardiopsis sp. N85]